MRKQIFWITVIWIIALLIILFITTENSTNDNDMYKITINRIHQRLIVDYSQNKEIVYILSDEELQFVKDIKIINYQDKTTDEIEKFLHVSDKEKVVFKPIEGTDYIIKYQVNYDESKENIDVLWVSLIIIGLYILSLIYRISLYKNIIRPMDKIKGITNQLARGYLSEVNLQYNNRYFKDFIWGLDMLREQLIYERNKNADLEKQQKDLVAGLSHDIKTPLSSVENYTIALKENVYVTIDDRDKALDIILEKVGVIDKLSKELLNASLKEIRNIEVNTKEIYMLEVHNKLNGLIHQKIDLLHMNYQETKLDDNLMVMVDLDRLQEVFDNIIENALKYGDLKTIEVNYYVEDHYQLIEIFNTGLSIPKTEMKHIFNSYYRGSNVEDKPGYGLGLYISKQIMKNMQGDLFAKNTENGVKFIVVIRQAG